MKKLTSLIFGILLVGIMTTPVLAKAQTTDKPPEWSYTATINHRGEIVPAIARDVGQLTNVFGSKQNLKIKGYVGVSSRSERPVFSGAVVYQLRISNEVTLDAGPGISVGSKMTPSIFVGVTFRP